jgi:hypothetical protein
VAEHPDNRCYVSLCYAVLCFVMLCYVISSTKRASWQSIQTIGAIT